ncbi:hypothetical protein LWI29_019736 [Acer saccharum]|uniref:Histone-lysine N-methyltransferase, H3 lysine-9 specific SUVH4 n=1 Tax=Acer saccharum TaxID=4024 RepID=A0AA39SPC2_ACESA|nr:hypothetical protein LWI29_019736 [Acer saccharum]
MQQKRPGRGNDQKRPLDAVKGQGREVRPRLQNKTDGEKETVKSQGDRLRCMCYSNSIVDNCGKGTFLKLKETLRLLNLHYLSLVKEEFLGYTFPIAATMLLSGEYEDSVDDLLEVVYTGQGGNDLVFNYRQVKDQDMHLGNLALKSLKLVGFTYIKSVKVAENVILPQSTADHGCNCKRICTNRRSCSCAKRNGSDFPYVRPRRGGGRLIEAKDVVFECGPSCKCGPGCTNRTSQQGLKYQLEVFRTKDKGWALRSLDFIPSGAPVSEYTGVLRRTDELDNVYENDFIFEIDCWHTMNEIGMREKRLCNVSVSTSDLVGMTNNEEESEREPEYCIDAGVYGNVARFINHSCEPNLFVQCVLSSHHDVRLARVVLFAADDIPPMQELTYDYGYELDSVVGPDGKIKKMRCICGTGDCRKRLY